MKILVWLTLFSALSCFEQGGSGGGGSKRNNEPYSPAAPITYNADVFGQEGIPFSVNAKNFFTDPPASWSGYFFVASNKPTWLSINSSTGELSGTPQGQGLFGNVVISAQKIGEPDYSASFILAVNGDPLRALSWHFENTGQTGFSWRTGYSNLSVNANPVYASGITGEGVRVAVSDSGVEINHDDLYQNSLAGEHKNYTSAYPYYGIPVASHFHGTAVASLIAGKGWNNIGSMGIAPNARFAGFQFLDSAQTSSILINQASGDFDIFNYSYGDYIKRDTVSDLSYLDHLRSETKFGRDGKGSIFVKSAGNEFRGDIACYSHNANAPYENESPFLIVVGAVNADGLRSSYSNAGSNLWISAPGGENGRSAGPAIIAADLPTCFKGLSKATSSPYNSFEYGHSLNAKCNYTSAMNGTSSAAPIVSGVIALMLEANPALKWRDVKHILAASAQQIDAASNASPMLKHPSLVESGCPDYSLTNHEYEQGWKTNTAGYSFHNYYGFGLVDAQAAVAMAASPPAQIPLPDLLELNPYFNINNYDSGIINLAIPDANKDGVTDVITVSSGGAIAANFKVESVQVQVQVSHQYSGEIGVELTSPGGTKSILLNINNSFLEPQCDESTCSVDSNLNITLSSNAFYGEPGIGAWTIKLIDGLQDYEGTLTRWKINLLGHNP